MRCLERVSTIGPEKQFYKAFDSAVVQDGLISVLRHGFKHRGISFRVCYFKPESELNESAVENYRKNVCQCIRQWHYSELNKNSVDMLLAINGIPVVAIELKNQLTGQSVDNAIRQWQYNRNPKEPAFGFNRRVLAYFAADLYNVMMTTKLDGINTNFLPFNQGSNGAGNDGGAGNPQNAADCYVTEYFWKEVLQKDKLMDILQKFISFEKSEKKKVMPDGSTQTTVSTKVLFPRYHQLDVVRKLVDHVRENGVGHDYLIQHSAGSGKSNSIAWAAYRMASLHDKNNEPVFNSVIVVTDRRVLDQQLQATVTGFDHTLGSVTTIDEKKNSGDLRNAINDGKRIIITTLQKFPVIYDQVSSVEGKRFAIFVDEAHSSQTGQSAMKLKQALADVTDALKEYAEIEGKAVEEIEKDDVPGGSLDNAVALQQYTTNGSSAQEFVFEEATDITENLQPAQSVANGTKYYIRSVASNLFLGLNNYSDTDGNSIVQNPYNGALNEQWNVVDTGNGYYKVVSAGSNSGKALDVSGGTGNDGASIDIYSDNGTAAQRWKISPNGDGTFTFFSACSNATKCVDVPNASTSSGTCLQQYSSNGSAAQRFILLPVPNQLNTAPATNISSGSTYYIQSNYSKLFIEPSGLNSAAGTSMVQDVRNGNLGQRWRVVQNADGYYTLRNVQSNLALDVAGGSNTNGTQVQIYTDNGSDAQRWQIIRNGDGTFKILPKCAGNTKGLDVDEASIVPQKDIHLWDYVNGANQNWNLIPVNDSSNTIQNSASYTSDGNYMSSMTDTRGNTVAYDYNHDANGNTLSSNEYNKGLLRTTTDANGNKTTYTYDANTDDITSAKATADGQTVSNSYGYSNDKLTSITHNGFNYAFGYDSFGNQKTVSAGSQALLTNNYEGNNGNLLSTNYGNGQSVGYAYDYYDRVTSRSYNGTTRYGWTYDAKGNIGVYTDNVNGNTYRYTYDFAGRPFRVDGSNGHTVQYSYDKNSSVNRLIQSLGSNSFNTTYDFNGDNLLSKLSMGLGDNLYLAYDGLNRLATKQFTFGSGKLTTGYSYLAGANGNTSTLVSGYKITKNTGGTDTSLHDYGYAYDKNGNITTISESGTQKAAYQYNELNELKREDNASLNKSIVYTYDAGGNLLSKTEYPYTTGTLGTATATHTYTYGDGNWKDKLTSYDGNAITYDAIGNPLNYYNGWNFGWEEGNQLATAKNSTSNISYKYNSDGIRTQKTVNGVTTTYYLEDGDVTWEQSGSDTIHYTYDKDGDLVYMVLNGSLYYYERNAQNDIIGLVDSNMNEVVTYTYDSWGKLLNVGGSLASTVGQKNPYRYRGYRYDSETGLYYLQSRYYDPNVGRFINADDTDVLNNTDKNLLSVNLFAYCENNPVNASDADGHFLWLLAVAAFIPGLDVVVGVAAVVVGAVVVGTMISQAISRHQSQVQLSEKSNNESSKKKRVEAPTARRVYNNGSKKKAYERAKRAGKGKEPKHHPNGHDDDPRPHYHPNVPEEQRRTPHAPSKHDHYYY